MHFYRSKKTSICIRLYKTEDCYLPTYLPACQNRRMQLLFVLLMNKTSSNSLIFYFDKAKQKNVCSGNKKFKNIPKYFVLLRRNNPLMLKGLKSVNLKIIQANLENIFVSPNPTPLYWYGSVGRKIIFSNFSNWIPTMLNCIQ